MIDFPQLEGAPVWIVTTLAVAAITVTLVERLAKLEGPLGAPARWFRDRNKRAVEVRAESDQLYKAMLDDRLETAQARIDSLEENAASVLSDLQTEQAKRRAESAAFDEELERRHRYSVYTAEVFRRLELWSAEEGIPLPPPPALTYTRWLDQQTPETT